MRGESSDKTPPLLRFVLELGLSESMGGDGRTSSHSSSWVSRSSLLPSLGVGGGGVQRVWRQQVDYSAFSFINYRLPTGLVKRPERGMLPLPSSNLPITRRQILGAAITPPALSHTHIRPLLLWNDTFVGMNIFSLFLNKARITLFPIPQVQMAVMLGIVDKIIRTANSSLKGQNNPIL